MKCTTQQALLPLLMMLQLVAKLTLYMHFWRILSMVSIHEKDDFSVNDTGSSEKNP